MLVWTFIIRVRNDGTEAHLILSGRDERADHCVLSGHIPQCRTIDLAQPEQESANV